jgi:hypothetical protein
MKLIVAILVFSAGIAACAAEPKPNVILMMGDDYGWEETGNNWHPHVKTPLLNEMSRTGLRFGRFDAAHSNGRPARASLLFVLHPAVTDEDHRRARSIIVGDHRLNMNEPKNGPAKVELFDFKADPAEKQSLAEQKPGNTQSLQSRLRVGQTSVLQRLTVADCR